MLKSLFNTILTTPFLLLNYCYAVTNTTSLSDQEIQKAIKLPKGFVISIFAENIDKPRSLALGKNGTIFVGTRENIVYALVDKDKNGKSDKTYKIAEGLFSPNGVAFRNGSLYVGEVNRIIRFDNIESKLDNPPKPITVFDKLPSETHHGWKYIAFGPDGKLYIPIGAPCNICKKDDERFSTITRINSDGSNFEIFSKGIRNSVGFDWNPNNKELYFTDNGRDWLGDNMPNDELNRAYKKGLDFGYPYCHSGFIPDPEFGSQKPCSSFEKPAMKLGAHIAPLGMKFYTGNKFPKKYHNQIFISEHGSWNKTNPDGYRITNVFLENGKATKYEVFADGWLKNKNVLGRPVDILNMPDGSILVSDDFANKIYKIKYVTSEK